MRKPILWIGAAIVLLIAAVAIVLLDRPRAAPAIPAAVPPASDANAAVSTPPPIAPTPVAGPGGFLPLQSQQVKDAIHRALLSGTTQRWQDGALSGYAVPSLTTGANGCRAVRYTIDQQPQAAYQSITACDASGH